MIKFKSGALTRLKSNMTLRMLITNTKVGRNTKALVAGVSERTLRHPDAMSLVFNAVDSISKELAAIIQSPAPDELSITGKEEKVEELMEMNQGLLQCMGVSHASIETVLRTTLKYKLASKLTGAGGGGCVLTLLPTRIHFLMLFIYYAFKLFLFSICFVYGFLSIYSDECYRLVLISISILVGCGSLGVDIGKALLVCYTMLVLEELELFHHYEELIAYWRSSSGIRGFSFFLFYW